MSDGFFNVPIARNEPVKAYAPNSAERVELQKAIAELKAKPLDIPLLIGGKEIRTGKTVKITAPHNHKLVLGQYHIGDKSHVEMAIDAAMKAKAEWENTSWEHRASVFLKAAELLAGPYRMRMNAATMLCQSKNIYQAEIDAACELIDFFKFNVQYMTEIYRMQPESAPGMWNRLEYRPLEGFVFALTPFNFTSIAGNLPTCPALMGNTSVWKPARTQVYSAYIILEILKEAGLPDGVVNFVLVGGADAGDVIFKHPDFGGIHFTGSTAVFKDVWKSIGENIYNYKSYPRIVGETGGKDFIIAHHTANAIEVATAISRGAFEFQGQKCSAASRAYIPESLWPEVKKRVIADVQSFKIGDPEDFTNFINAVIDEKAFDRIASYIDFIKKAPDAEIIVGGNYDKSQGYFIEPTVVLTSNPTFKTMCEEIFGPVITIFVYPDNSFEETCQLVNSTSEYALTGALFATDRYAIEQGSKMLRHAAGNYYINDKPTGAVVGQQPFGGARGSGTNDKAGSLLNLIRWVSARTIKETFVPAKSYEYPFHQK